jgi:hypothetical protein
VGHDRGLRAAVVREHVPAGHQVVAGRGQAGVGRLADPDGRLGLPGDLLGGGGQRRPVAVHAVGAAARADLLGQQAQHRAGAAAHVGHRRAGPQTGGGQVAALVGPGHLGHQPVAGPFVLAQRQRVRHGVPSWVAAATAAALFAASTAALDAGWTATGRPERPAVPAGPAAVR